MIVTVVKGVELGGEHVAAWERIREGNSTLRSPFFSSAFLRCVAGVRDDTFVGVISRDGVVCGFLPFHRGRLGIGKALGFPYADYHGLVAADDAGLDLRAVVRACGLRTLDFLYAPTAATAFAPHAVRAEPSPVVRLERYRDRPAEWRKARQLERDLGPLEFRPFDADPAAFETLCRWKNEQCARTGFGLMLDKPWLRDLLWAVVTTREPGFAGALSTLRAGGELVAVHAGPTSPDVWHWWFPAYAVDRARYSPGLLMLLSMLKHAKAAGADHLDFGTSSQFFKERFADDAFEVCQGSVVASPLGAAAVRAKRVARTVVRSEVLQRFKNRLRGGGSRDAVRAQSQGAKTTLD